MKKLPALKPVSTDKLQLNPVSTDKLRQGSDFEMREFREFQEFKRAKNQPNYADKNEPVDFDNFDSVCRYAKSVGAEDILTTYVYSGGVDMQFAKRKYLLRKKHPEIAKAYDKQMNWNIDPNVEAYLAFYPPVSRMLQDVLIVLICFFALAFVIQHESNGKISVEKQFKKLHWPTKKEARDYEAFIDAQEREYERLHKDDK